MLLSLKKDWRVKLLVVLFILLTFWWRLSPEIVGEYDYGFHWQFGSVYFILALFGGLCGLVAARRQYGNSYLSRAQLFFAFGLLCQVFGQVAYAYYDAVHNLHVPYPSLGDIGYFLHIPFYLLGIFFLARSAKVDVWLQSFENKFQAAIISGMTLVIAYGLFLHEYIFDGANFLKIFLDFAYPLGQAIYICVAILAYLAIQADQKNVMKNLIFLALIALITQFLCDYMFVYQVSRGTWILGGNNDYLYLISYFVMSFTVLSVDVVGEKIR